MTEYGVKFAQKGSVMLPHPALREDDDFWAQKCQTAIPP
jgi:hypothetical protein